MRVISVLDLMGGVVVRGVGGRRHEYAPVQSGLCDSAEPLAVAGAFATRLGLHEHYVADLDAIAGQEPAWPIYDALVTAGASLWIDAGLRTVVEAQRLAAFGDVGVVAGLETTRDVGTLRRMLDVVGADRLLFSLDMKDGRPLGGPGWNNASPIEIAQQAIEHGVRRMIVLDLANVGEGQGVGTEELCRAIHSTASVVELVAGGGVRGVDDLRRLADAGCSAALVASALHDGRITGADLDQFR